MKSICDLQEVNIKIENYINNQFKGKPIKILEAGCGRSWNIKLNVPYSLIGVDINKIALSKRKDIDCRIQGDLRHKIFSQSIFDVIYCSYVLEHIKGVDIILHNFHDYVKPTGIIILKIPTRDCVFGFMTRITPFRIHIWYHRYVMKNKMTGLSGFGPYPTVYDKRLSIKGIHRFCDDNGLKINEELFVAHAYKRSKLTKWVAKFIGFCLPWLSAKYTGVIYILKPA